MLYLKLEKENEIEYLEEIIMYMDNIALVVPQDKKPVLDEISIKLKKIIN